MADLVLVQVLFHQEEAERFNAYCREKGFKKSPLIARLVRKHLNREAFNARPGFPDQAKKEPKQP